MCHREATPRIPCSTSIVHGYYATASSKGPAFLPITHHLDQHLHLIFSVSFRYIEQDSPPNHKLRPSSRIKVDWEPHLLQTKEYHFHAENCMNFPCAPSLHLAYFSTGAIAPTLQLSQMGANPLTLKDGWLDVDQSRKEHLKVSLSASYRPALSSCLSFALQSGDLKYCQFMSRRL